MSIERRARRVAIIAASVLLAACALPGKPLPDNYAGPTAVIIDTATEHGPGKADLFYLTAIDDRAVEDSRTRTLEANRGRGFAMSPVTVSRKVAAHPARFAIVGRTEFGAPIAGLAGTVYQVKGTVEFTPEPDHVYLVRGSLAEEGSAIWIEDRESKTMVGRKIEVRGPATLGFFEK